MENIYVKWLEEYINYFMALESRASEPLIFKPFFVFVLLPAVFFPVGLFMICWSLFALHCFLVMILPRYFMINHKSYHEDLSQYLTIFLRVKVTQDPKYIGKVNKKVIDAGYALFKSDYLVVPVKLFASNNVPVYCPIQLFGKTVALSVRFDLKAEQFLQSYNWQEVFDKVPLINGRLDLTQYVESILQKTVEDKYDKIEPILTKLLNLNVRDYHVQLDSALKEILLIIKNNFPRSKRFKNWQELDISICKYNFLSDILDNDLDNAVGYVKDLIKLLNIREVFLTVATQRVESQKKDALSKS